MSEQTVLHFSSRDFLWVVQCVTGVVCLLTEVTSRHKNVSCNSMCFTVRLNILNEKICMCLQIGVSCWAVVQNFKYIEHSMF